MDDIVANIQMVGQTIGQAAKQVGRDPHSVRLVAATKHVGADRLVKAVEAGVTIFGENRWQEARAKMERLGKSSGLAWHFIGRLQRRKLKDLVGRFALIHSVESIPCAQELNRRAEEYGLRQPVLLEVNIGDESTKGGFLAVDLLKAIPVLAQLPHLQIQGLMTIPPWNADPEASRPYFRAMRELAEAVQALQIPNIQMTELSMGMSHDYPLAIQEGATFVRIGTALFGDRSV